MRDFDCCMCDVIECGLMGQGCDTLRLGDYAAFGVKDIQVFGNQNNLNGGALIFCSGTESCRETQIVATYVHKIDCQGPRSCQDAVFSITDPANGFVLRCSGVESCSGLTIDVYLSGPPPGFMCNVDGAKETMYIPEISCGADRACDTLSMTIHNDGCKKAVIDMFECTVERGCDAAMFTFVGDVNIAQCSCGPSCVNTIGLDKCEENLSNVICRTPEECKNVMKTITNPANGFFFECRAAESCSNSLYKIVMDGHAFHGAITQFGIFRFSGVYSIENSVFVFENQQRNGVTINRIECSGVGACRAATFVLDENVFIDRLVCDPGACPQCLVKHTKADPGIPCETYNYMKY